MATQRDSMSKRAKNSKKSDHWIKHGLILEPSAEIPWMHSHVSVPCLEHLQGDVYRMYFCSRDAQNRNQIGYADINLKDPKRIISVSQKPVFGLGPLGTFDDNGVTPTWVLNVGKKKFLYYVGWNKGTTVRMHLFAGLAISTDGGKSFKRYSNAPLLERIPEDPYLTATLSILREKGKFRMWYVSGDYWVAKDGETFPYYNIKYAESRDGIHWKRTGKVCIDYSYEGEHAIARPCVIKENGTYKMWFSHKGKDYRIGYAESKDGLKWKRMDDQAGITVSENGFDSTMQEYAFVVSHKGKKHMFYNGDEYGKYGIGYASCDE